MLLLLEWNGCVCLNGGVNQVMGRKKEEREREGKGKEERGTFSIRETSDRETEREREREKRLHSFIANSSHMCIYMNMNM